MSDTPVIRNREAWLTDFVSLSLPLIRSRTGLSISSGTFKISCGFPSRGGTANKNRTIGQCHHVGATGRKVHQLFIHPQLIDPVEIGGVALHEILHAMLPAGTGHRKPFSQAAKKLGLEGKPTATTVGEELAERIKEITEQLGEYPHESLDASGGPKQTTRLLKAMCPLCGYIVRVTSKWIDEAGTPICPQCMISMEEAGTDAEASMPLYALEQTVEYSVKPTAEMKAKAKLRGFTLVFDPRWSLRMNRRSGVIQWWVIDYGTTTTDYILPDGTTAQKAVLGTVTPRLTPAENRQDAIALMEALRDGSMSYKDIEVNDDDGTDMDYNDPRLDDAEDPEEDLYEGDETFDFEDSDSDPRFQHEKDRGMSVEEISAEREADKREAWAVKERESFNGSEAEVNYDERVKELERQLGVKA